MDETTRRRLAELTNAVMGTVLNLGADTPTTLRLISRASSLLSLLHKLYDQRDRQAFAALLEQWELTEDATDASTDVPALPEP